MLKKPVLVVLSVLAVCGVSYAFYAAGVFKPKNKNVVFIMIDTLRADHLGVYGYHRKISPNLDKFAQDNLMFSYAVSSSPWTPPAVATMFTGLYPVSHGCVPPNGVTLAKGAGTKLSSDLVTLAEVFKAHGYQTAGASPNPWINEEFGFDQGFDSFWYKPRVDASHINTVGKRKTEEFLETGKPFFLYLHYLDPHDPYKPGEEYKAAIAQEPAIEGYTVEAGFPPETKTKLDLYDAEILYTDKMVGEMLAFFKEKGLYDDLSIVIMADHGEQFMERGHQGHGFKLFDEEVHVPLMIKSSQVKSPKRVDLSVSTVDVFPTVLEMAGLPIKGTLPGVSLFDEKAIGERKGVFSEINRKINEQRAFTTPDGIKLIVEIDPTSGEKVIGAFNSKNDPKEVQPIDEKELVMTLNNELQQTRQFALEGRIAPSDTSHAQMKDSTIEQLKTLGYLQ